MKRGALGLCIAGMLAGCAGTGQEAAPPPAQSLRAPGGGLALPRPGTTGRADDAPHVYMALQPDASGALSVIFAIDDGRDNTPSDDPAIRLTPQDGKCNPQELGRYNFPPENARRPVFSGDEATRGITARDLPNFMAMMVTSEMMRQGLIVEPQESQPQNVCTRKLWEQLVVAESAGQG